MRITVRLLTRDYTSIHKSTTESKKRISWLKIFEKKTLIPDQYLDGDATITLSLQIRTNARAINRYTWFKYVIKKNMHESQIRSA